MREAAPPQRSLFREELYQLELEYCKYYKRDDVKSDQVRRKISSLILKNCPDWNEWSQREIRSIFEIYNSINLSNRTLRNLINLDVSGLSDISTSSFGEATSYVGAITNLDLSNIQEVQLERHECAYTEGECVSCNVNNHHIYYSLDSNQVSSVDLLCHEVGHAADFTNARQGSADDKVLLRHQSLAEAVAFYCQFRYLQDYGTAKKRTGSLGSFTYTYLTYLICCYCFDKGISLDKVDPVKIIEHELFSPFVAGYTPVLGLESAKDFLAEKVHETQVRFQGLGNIILEELNPRLGIPLGLALLGIEDLDLSQVSTMNILSIELKQVVQAIDPRLMEKLSDMDTLVANFIAQVE